VHLNGSGKGKAVCHFGFLRTIPGPQHRGEIGK